jgi:hypothetical protein
MTAALYAANFAVKSRRKEMTRMNAVKQFLSKDSSRPVTTPEFMAFWKACNEQERDEFGQQSAKEIGEQITTV